MDRSPEKEQYVKVITSIIRANSDREHESFDWDRWAQGSIQYQDRWMAVAKHYLSKWPGDVVEIGAMAGGTTVRLAVLAEDRQVIVIDPWETGTQNCAGWEYETYLENTEEFTNILTLRMESQDKRAFEYLKDRELAFAIVDGLHEYDACLSDVELVTAAPIIVVDDILWNTEVEKAFVDFGTRADRTMVRSPLCKEGYLVG